MPADAFLYISRSDFKTPKETDIQFKRRHPKVHAGMRDYIRTLQRQKDTSNPFQAITGVDSNNIYFHASLRNQQDCIESRHLTYYMQEVIRCANIFDVNTIATQEHNPTKQQKRKFLKAAQVFQQSNLELLIHQNKE